MCLSHVVSRFFPHLFSTSAFNQLTVYYYTCSNHKSQVVPGSRLNPFGPKRKNRDLTHRCPVHYSTGQGNAAVHTH